MSWWILSCKLEPVGHSSLFITSQSSRQMPCPSPPVGWGKTHRKPRSVVMSKLRVERCEHQIESAEKCGDHGSVGTPNSAVSNLVALTLSVEMVLEMGFRMFGLPVTTHSWMGLGSTPRIHCLAVMGLPVNLAAYMYIMIVHILATYRSGDGN